MMAERGGVAGAQHYHALGDAFYAGVRQALESFGHTQGAVMAC